jgi:hypothetical protein
MRKLACLLTILLVGPICAAAAQDRTPLLEPGARVRVTAPDLGITKQAATFDVLEGGTLVVTADSTMYCPLRSVTQLEVHAGRRSKWGTGAVVGGVVGGAGGALALGLFCQGYAAPGHDCSSDMKSGFLGGALGGALLGMGIGAAITTDRWEEVPLDRLRVSVVPQRGGVALGISVAF